MVSGSFAYTNVKVCKPKPCGALQDVLVAVAGDPAAAAWLLAQMQPAAQGSGPETLGSREPLLPGPAPAADDGGAHAPSAPGDASCAEWVSGSRGGRPRREQGAENEGEHDLYGTERREAAQLTRRWRSAARRAAVAYAGRMRQLGHACCCMPAVGR